MKLQLLMANALCGSMILGATFFSNAYATVSVAI